MLCDLIFAFYGNTYVTVCFDGHPALDDSYMWRSATPSAADVATRNNVHVEVRGALTRNNTVVLYQVYPVWVVGLDKCFRCSTDCVHNRSRLFLGEIEYGRSVTFGYNQDLPQLELIPVYERSSVVCFFDNRLFSPACDCFTQVA